MKLTRRTGLALLALCLWLVSVATAHAAGITLTVFAAASLAEPFQEMGKAFTTRHPGVRVVFNLAGSQELAQQLDNGAPADVFAAASQLHMAQAVTGKRVAAGASRPFAHNRLIVIISTSSKDNVRSLPDLAKPGLKVVLGDESVPVGRYARQFLDKAGKAPGFGDTYRAKVLANTVSFEPNVRLVVTKVALGEADAGIAYVSDVQGTTATKIATLAIPETLNVLADYPIAPVANSPSPAMAKAFVDFVTSRQGQAILVRHGFMSAAPSARWTPNP